MRELNKETKAEEPKPPRKIRVPFQKDVALDKISSKESKERINLSEISGIVDSEIKTECIICGKKGPQLRVTPISINPPKLIWICNVCRDTSMFRQLIKALQRLL